MAVIRNLVVKIGADINGLTKGLKSAQQQLDRVSKKMSKVGKSLTTAFTVPLVSFTALAIKSSGDVEASMLTIEKSFNATGKEMESLINVAKKMSSKTVCSINEVATAMNYLKSAGYSVAQMEKSLSTLTNLAVASNVELEQATADVVKVLGQFNLGADKTDKVANVMSATMSKTSLTLDGLTTALSLVGKTSSSVGYSVEDTAGAIAMLSNAGFSAEKSGSYLKSVLLQLQSPTTEMIKVLDDLGLSVEDINPKTNSLSDILQKFADAGLMSSQTTKMFGNEVDSAFMSLVGQGANSLNSLIISITDTNSAEEEAQKQLSTLSNQLKIVKNQLIKLSIQFGEILLPIVKNFLSNTVMPLIEKFSNLSDKSKQLAIKIGAIATAIGPAILIIAKLLKTMSALSGLFSIIISPISLVILAIASAIAILVTLYKTNEEFRAVVQSVWEKIKDIVTTVISDIKDFWDKHGKAIMEAVTKVFNIIWSVISSVLTSIMRGIETLFTYVKPIWEQLKKLFMSLWDVMCQLYELLKPVFDAIGALVITCWAITSGIIEGAISALGPLIQAVLNVLQIVIDVVGAIVSLFRGDFSSAFEHVKNIGENFKNFFVNLCQGILNFGKGFVDGFVNLFKSLGIDIESIFKNVCNAIGTFFSNIWGGIKSVATGIWDTITNVFGSIGDWFANLWKTAFNWGKNLINSIGDGIKSAWNWVKDACSSVIGTIKGWLGFGSPTKEGPGRYADTWAPNLMEMYSEGIESSIPDIQSAVNDVADVLSNIDGGYKTNVATGNTSLSSDILNGLLTAMNTNRNINSESGKNIELSIDGTVFARLIYPALTKEFKRNGMLLKEGGFI